MQYILELIFNAISDFEKYLLSWYLPPPMSVNFLIPLRTA